MQLEIHMGLTNIGHLQLNMTASSDRLTQNLEMHMKNRMPAFAFLADKDKEKMRPSDCGSAGT